MININNLGILKPDSHFSDWLRSDPIKIPFFDNLPIPFIITLGSELDEALRLSVEKAVENFLNLSPLYRIELSDLVIDNYQEMLNAADIKPLPITTSKDIWKYVYPKEIYVDQRSRRDKDIYIQVSCECAWEEEHGLQLVFRQGKKITRVSEQDGHLTESDAYDKDDAKDLLLSKF